MARQPTSLVTLVLVTFPAIAMATPETSGPATRAARPITLSDALAYAREHQPEIRAALARVDAERANARVPRAEWQPVVSTTLQGMAATANNTTASYIQPDDLVIPRIGGTRSTSSSASFQPYASTLAGAGIMQEVFDFGRIAAHAAAADANVTVASHDADAARLDVELSVEEAYFAVYAAHGVLSAAEEATQRAREHRDLANAGVTSGLRSPIELTRAEADLGRYQVALIQARGGLEVAETVLAASIGAPETPLDVTGAPPNPGDAPALDEALRLAMAREPHLQSTLARLAAQERKTRAIASNLRPNIWVTGTVTGRAGGAAPTAGPVPAGDGFAPDVPNWDVALVFNWTLFDGVTFARRDASNAEEATMKEDVALQRERLVANVTQAYVRLGVVRDAVPALEASKRGAEANYQQADQRFRSGLGNQVELADAQNIRTQAEVALTLGTFDVARARAELGRVIAEGL